MAAPTGSWPSFALREHKNENSWPYTPSQNWQGAEPLLEKKINKNKNEEATPVQKTCKALSCTLPAPILKYWIFWVFSQSWSWPRVEKHPLDWHPTGWGWAVVVSRRNTVDFFFKVPFFVVVVPTEKKKDLYTSFIIKKKYIYTSFIIKKRVFIHPLLLKKRIFIHPLLLKKRIFYILYY